MSKHTLSVLVENKPGVLARISALFSRRGFNIDSLAVGPTEHPDISRITVVVDVEELPLEQVTKQLNKLVEVLKVVELDRESSVQRQIVLVKVRADASNRSHIVETAELFRAKVVDVASDSLTIEATGKVVVSVTDQTGEARYPSFKGIMAAKKKEVQEWSLSDLGLDAGSVGLDNAWSKVESFEPRPPRTAGEIVTDEGDGGTKLAEFLASKKFV